MRRNRKKPDAVRGWWNRLGSPSSDVRYQAYLDAQHLSAEQLWEIVAVPARQARRSSRRAMTGNIIAWAWVALAVWTASFTTSFTPFIVTSILFALALLPLFVSRRLSQECLYISLGRLLEHQEDARFVGPMLLIYAGLLDRDVHASARRSLLRLLPKLDDTHTKEWTAAHKAALLELARHSWGDLESVRHFFDAFAYIACQQCERMNTSLDA